MSYKKSSEMNKYELVLLAKSLYNNVNEFVIDPSRFTSPMEIVRKIENGEFDLSAIKNLDKKEDTIQEELNIEGLL
jgi:hypothetical protein